MVGIELIAITFAISTIVNLREFTLQDSSDKSAGCVALLLQFVELALEVLRQLNHDANKPRHTYKPYVWVNLLRC